MIKTAVRGISLDQGKEITLEVVSNIDDLIAKAVNEDDLPFWAELWPSAVGLARYLWREENLSDCRVLELGAGMGLSGIAAALKGGQVTQTDFIPQALDLAARNCLLNKIDGVIQQEADWRRFPITAKFEVIVGSDILYEPVLHPYIAGILNNNLLDHGQVILSDPGRKFAGDFLQYLGEAWTADKQTLTVEERERSYSIDIYKLHKI